MRIEDWQAWLETQFVDESAVVTRPIEPLAPAPATGPSLLRRQPTVQELMQVSVPATQAPSSRPGSAETLRVEAAPAVPNAPSIEAATPQTLQGGEEVELPTLDQFIPFLKNDAPVTSSTLDHMDTVNELMSVGVIEEEAAQGPPAPLEQALELGDGEHEELTGVLELNVPIEALAHDQPALESAEEEPVAQTADEVSPADALEERDEPADMIALAEDAVMREELDHQRRERQVQRRYKASLPAEIAVPLSPEAFWKLAPRGTQTAIDGLAGQVGTHQEAERCAAQVDAFIQLFDWRTVPSQPSRLGPMSVHCIAKAAKVEPLSHFKKGGDPRRYSLTDVLRFLETSAPTTRSSGR